MNKAVVVLILLFGFTFANAQTETENYTKDIAYYSDIVANSYAPEHKVRANKALHDNVKTFLSTPNSFEDGLENAKWLSIKYPENRAFRIITWQLQKKENSYQYFGFIQMKDGTFFELNDTSSDDNDVEYSIFDKDDWYGALYYNMIPSGAEEGSYLLFGYDAFGKYDRRKVLDVLSFSDGQPVFGSEIFYKKEGEERAVIKNRILLQYSSDANVTLNYNPAIEMITHDHLISRMGQLPGQGATFLPDGSYVGYKLNNGKWEYVEKLYDQVTELDKYPRRSGNKESGKKDIFGRSKG